MAIVVRTTDAASLFDKMSLKQTIAAGHFDKFSLLL